MVDTFFFFNDTATTEIYTLSLHDALPIYEHVYPVRARQGLQSGRHRGGAGRRSRAGRAAHRRAPGRFLERSEEHTSELQSRQYLVCRLLLENKTSPLQSLPLRDMT